jgi:hypothetical protein
MEELIKVERFEGSIKFSESDTVRLYPRNGGTILHSNMKCKYTKMGFGGVIKK